MPPRPASSRGDQLTAHSTALVCQDADIRGTVTIGAGAVVHPKAAIYGLGGGVVLGADCVVEEGATIVNRTREVMVIGRGCHFMVGCRVDAPSVGEYNTFHPRSKVSSAVRVADHCSFGAGTVTLDGDVPSCTVVYGAESLHRKWDRSTENAEANVRTRHLEYLRDMLPKYNRLRVV